ncbi:MAG: alpha/beta hydrolase [Chloroflexi bacterium]|nr:alpha/beta hydrolase [Chloroflexota bacterium]
MRVNGGNLYYEMKGDGETVVLAHAGFVDSRMWDAQWEELAQHYQVVRFDLRGFGKSDPATGPVSRRDDLYQLLKGLGAQRVHLVGCSMSGENAIDVALEHPEIVASITVVSAVPSGFELQGAPPAGLFEMMAAMQQGDIDRASELQLRIWIDGPNRQPQEVNDHVRQCAAEMNRIPVHQATFAIADMEPLAPLDPPAIHRLNELHIPTLIIAGAEDNAEILRAADVMAQAINGAHKVILADCAHLPNMECPEAFNGALLEHLRTAS